MFYFVNSNLFFIQRHILTGLWQHSSVTHIRSLCRSHWLSNWFTHAIFCLPTRSLSLSLLFSYALRAAFSWNAHKCKAWKIILWCQCGSKLGLRVEFNMKLMIYMTSSTRWLHLCFFVNIIYIFIHSCCYCTNPKIWTKLFFKRSILGPSQRFFFFLITVLQREFGFLCVLVCHSLSLHNGDLDRKYALWLFIPAYSVVFPVIFCPTDLAFVC